MNNKIIIVVVGVIIIALFGYALWANFFSHQTISPQPASSKLTIVASFYPLAEFARQVGGDKVEVTNLTPAGAEPHDYELTPRDVITLNQAQVFIYNGLTFEPWVNKVLPELQQRGAVLVKGSDGISTLSSQNEEVGPYDPHYWLNPKLAQTVVSSIANGLAEADKTNREYYQARAQVYQAKLATLDSEFTAGLAQCQRHEFITTHAAFAYMAQQYHLNQLAISGLSPDEEPSPQHLVQVAGFAKEHNLKYIFFETLISPRLAQTIAREVDAQTLVLNPIEGLTDEEQAQGKDYLSVQRDNLTNLRLALACL